MELVERDGLLATLQAEFQKIITGEGHCIFLSGEAGIGKTSLVKAFLKEQTNDCNIYQGACDSMYTPRPLAPLHDIMWQMNSKLWPNSHAFEDRSKLFADFFREVSNQKQRTLIIFEDVQWADEATLDFIKFFARRITHLRCLFILTYRDNEIHIQHSLRNVLGQLAPDTFSRLQLAPLSRPAVEKMALEKGYRGEDVYTITGGNPFYVTEILSSYNQGVPDNIKDSILSAYNRTEERTRQIWDLLSVSPAGVELKYLAKFEPLYVSAIENCLEQKILFLENGTIFFKHELFRRAIEVSLSPLKRIALNKRFLELCQESFEENQEIERIIHHAKNANEYGVVAKFAPIAARHAATVGAHTEASKLYFTAIEYYQGNDKDLLIQFYESYAYECYLINQVKEAIIYSGKLLELLKEEKDIEKTGNCLRFLSRLWWLDGNRKKAEYFGEQAIEVFGNLPSSPSKAMAFSNMSQLKLLFDQTTECITWGEKSIEIAREVGDEETLSHALNNVGCVQMLIQSSYQKGYKSLQQSLQIALRNAYHDNAGRAYCNLGSIAMRLKNYSLANQILEEGIQYCEERDLDSWRFCMLTIRARLNLETGNWKEAYSIADKLLKDENQPTTVVISVLPVVASIKMRTGDTDVLPLLTETLSKAFENMEMQRIIPSLVALLEYEWLTGKTVIKTGDLERAIGMMGQSINNIENNEFAFWLLKARKKHLPLDDLYEGYDVGTVKKAQKAAVLWEKLGCPYVKAMVLFEGDDDDKRQAIKIVHELGATAIYEKMKMQMRMSGIKSIPRGLRKTTLSNAAQLTIRELDVLQLLKEGLQNKEIASRLFISAKTVDHHISSILFKLDSNSRTKAVKEAISREIIK
ncbi:MAG TPA: AAA family ATPase [Chitinophagaceae bacterium]|nr:AAA family ATPase [Chitinophagaceae bacterium]